MSRKDLYYKQPESVQWYSNLTLKSGVIGLRQYFWCASTLATYSPQYVYIWRGTKLSSDNKTNKLNLLSWETPDFKWVQSNCLFFVLFLHSSKDQQSSWNNSISLNVTLSLGLPLAFIYRAFCYRMNPSIQVRTSIHHKF